MVQNIELQKITATVYNVRGKVSKPDGSAAAGATVQVLSAVDNTFVGQAATTAADGSYTLAEIPAGTYKIIASLNGFVTGVKENVNLVDADLSEQYITLQIFTANTNAIQIIYSDGSAMIANLPADGSVTASTSGADITVASSSNETVEFYVTGSTSNGSLKIQNNASVENTLRIELNNAVITSTSALPPIQITKNEGVVVFELIGNNILSDNSSNGENATLISKSGSLEFEGYGKLTVTGVAKHAIGSSKKSITVRNGEIVVTSAASDGFHAENGFEMVAGWLSINASGDAIDAGSGAATINGGNINIVSTTADTKGIKGDAGVSVGSGKITMNVSGAQSKGISSKADVNITNGNLIFVMSGTTVLEALNSGYDPSYCTAIKSDANINISGGTIQIESKAASDGGKGISADGDINVSAGTINISTAGDGKVYTNESGTTDSYTATCIKSDQNISLTGGNITVSSSGTGGKGIAADGTITIGNTGANNADLLITATTSGERFYVSGSTGGGGGGRPGGGGFGDNGTDYANPKAIKCEGNMTINSGTIYVNCTQNQEGGEGMESKSTLTINGGNITVNTYDDCLNAATAIVINGGNTYCAARGQDAIDSNGSLTINGGLTIANGVRGDGEAFDAETNFKVNGGIIVGTHGGNAMTSPAGTQKTLRISAQAGSAIAVKNSAGEYLLLFTVPVISGASAGSSLTVTFSDPRLKSGSYTVIKGGSISGGTTVNGYNSGGTYTGGTSSSVSV